MTMNPQIIGLTLNYRDPERTRRCVESLLAEQIAQVLIWDNSGDDGMSAAALRRLLAGQPHVTIHECPNNLGFAAGVNHSLALIREPYPDAWVLLINNDARLLPGAVEHLRTALIQNPNAAIAYPRIDHNGHVLGTAYYQRHLGLLSFDKPLPGSFPYASGCVLLIAPERIKPPLFNEDFFMYGEDWLLSWRLGSRGMAFVPQVLAHHEGSASSHLGSPFYETRLVAAHWILARKLARNRSDRLRYQTGRWLVLTARAGIRALRYRSLVPLQALVSGWREARRIENTS